MVEAPQKQSSRDALQKCSLQLATFLQTVSVTGYVRVPANVAKFYVIAVLKNTSEWLLLTSEWRKNMIR